MNNCVVKNYEEFKELFVREDGTRKNGILLAFHLNRKLITLLRKEGVCTENIKSMPALKAAMLDFLSFGTIADGSEVPPTLAEYVIKSGYWAKKYRVKLMKYEFCSNIYATDDAEGLCFDGDFRQVRYLKDTESAASEDGDEPEFDIKSEALAAVLTGEIQAHFHAHRVDDVFTAVRISREFGLKSVLVHCTEGHLNAEKLAEEGIPAIVGPMIGTRTKPELANMRDENAAILKKAGVEVAICTDHPEVPIKYLPLSAAVAVRAGMNHDDAVRAITSVPAKILGLEDRIGSIAPGRDADLVVFNGNPLSVYNVPVCVLVNGKFVKEP